MSSTMRRPETELYGETHGTRWSDDPALAGVFFPDEPRTQRLLDEDVAAMQDDLQDAIVGPVIDRQRLEEWEESRARDFDVTDEVPY